MCGILFVKEFNAKNSSCTEEIFKQALNLMGYRGPDSYRWLKEDNCLFGHVRLSIIDLSDNSTQPFKTKNGILLFNGEIYNYKDLSSDPVSDTVVLAQLLERNQLNIEMLEGMYGLLFYNKAENTIKIVRDFFGEKPLYYYYDERVFIVSSTLKSIKYILKNAYHITLEVNDDSVVDYLGFGFVKEPLTIYKKVHMLLSGHALTLNQHNELILSSNTNRLTRKFQLNPSQYLQAAIQSTDVPQSLLLSGGVDSTYLLHEFHQLKIDPALLIYQHPDKRHDEVAEALSHVKNIDSLLLSKINIINDVLVANDLSDFAELMEQPSSDGINLFMILRHFRSISPSAKLIYTGLGGDEMFGGYNSFKYYKYFQCISYLNFLKSDQFRKSKWSRFLLKFDLDTSSAELFYFLYRLDIATLVACNVSMDQIQKCYMRFTENMKPYHGLEKQDYMAKIKVCETMDYMKNQLLRDNDNIAMYFGFESRSPLLARSLYEIKPDFKMGLRTTLKELYNIKFKPKKGFSVKINFSQDEKFLLRFKYFFGFKCAPNLSSPTVRKINTLLLWDEHQNA